MIGAWPRRLRLSRRNVLGIEGIDPHRSGDVLEPLLATILERQRQLALEFVEYLARNAHAAWIGGRLQANGDVHAVADDILVLRDDDVAEVDPHAHPDAERPGPIAPQIVDGYLSLDGAQNSLDGTGELYKRAIAHCLHHPPAVAGDGRLDNIREDTANGRDRALLVLPHET
jgi:hypothetical protein